MIARMNNILRPFFVALAMSVWHVSVLLIPGMMPAMGAEDDDSGGSERVQLSPTANVQQLFRPGKVAKLVYHFSSDEDEAEDLALTYVPQGKLGKKCSYGYTSVHVEDETRICGFFIACKKSKDNYIVYMIFRGNTIPIEVHKIDYKLIDNVVYSRSDYDPFEAFSDGLSRWECLTPDLEQIEAIQQAISTFEGKNKDEVKRMNMFAKFISKAFNDRGEVGVKSAIKNSKKYTLSDSSVS